MTLRGLLLAVAVAVVGGLALGPAAPAQATRNCSPITVDGAQVAIKAIRGATCATARRVLRAYLVSDAPCSGSSCTRSHAGWTCQASASYAAPRLASCSRPRAVIAAYSTAP